MNELERRIERLETGLRRWRLGAVCAGVLVLSAGLLGARSEDPEIRTSRLVLVDDKGRARAALAVSRDGTAMIGLMDGARKTRASLFVAEDGVTGLSLADRSQIPRVKLELSPGGEQALVAVLDGQEKPRAEMRVAEDGSPSLKLSDSNGKTLALLPQGKP